MKTIQGTATRVKFETEKGNSVTIDVFVYYRKNFVDGLYKKAFELTVYTDNGNYYYNSWLQGSDTDYSNIYIPPYTEEQNITLYLHKDKSGAKSIMLELPSEVSVLVKSLID